MAAGSSLSEGVIVQLLQGVTVQGPYYLQILVRAQLRMSSPWSHVRQPMQPMPLSFLAEHEACVAEAEPKPSCAQALPAAAQRCRQLRHHDARYRHARDVRRLRDVC